MNVKRKLPELAAHEHEATEPECLIIPSEDTNQEDTILIPIGSIEKHILYITTDQSHMEEIEHLEELKDIRRYLGA